MLASSCAARVTWAGSLSRIRPPPANFRQVCIEKISRLKQNDIHRTAPPFRNFHRRDAEVAKGRGGGEYEFAAVEDNPLFPFPDRLSSVFSALGEKANS